MGNLYLSFAAAIIYFQSVQFYNNSYQSPSIVQNWSNPGLITSNDNWNGVAGIEGYLGQDLTTTTGTDPRTILGESIIANDLTVLANQNNTAITNGDVAEFDAITDGTIALQGSATADAPYIIFYVNTTGFQSVNISYNVRDIDGSADNAIQQVALHYRIGATGNFTNIPGGYIADATTGPGLATLVTPVNITLPAACNNQAQLQIRVMTTNALNADEWVGIDDILITGSALLPVNFGFVTAIIEGKTIKLEFSNETESGVVNYTIEHSSNGYDFRGIATISPLKNDGGIANYCFTDKTPFYGINFYRIRSLENNGVKKFSIIVKTEMNLNSVCIVVFPNPATTRELSILIPALEKDQYSIRVYNLTGLEVYHRHIKHLGGTLTELLCLPELPAGCYQLVLFNRKLHYRVGFVLQ
jgi:hypothetical protein